MKDFAIVYLSGHKNDEAPFEIHKAGCRDLAKKENHKAVRAGSIETLIGEDLKGELEDIGYTEEDYEVMPCARAN